jgi:outer membrane protein OmpA-like peptidoglycan-associated protein
MRFAASVIVCLGFAFASTAAAAQEAPKRTVEDYLCAFAGECGDEPKDEGPEISRNGPELGGASVYRRPPAAAKAATATAARRPSSPAVASIVSRRPIAASPAGGPRQVARNVGRGSSYVTRRGISAGRADLMLTFELASANLTAEAMREAEVFARSVQLPVLAAKRFVIEGHTDSIGGQAYNQDLSRRRAEAVAGYLSRFGVGRERLQVKGYGFDRPLPGRSRRSPANRRVEAVLVP